MKKLIEYLYLFSKFSTSLVFFILLTILGYFFITSYKNQENLSNNKSEIFYNELKNNTEQLDKVSKKIAITDNALEEIKQLLEKNLNKNNLEEINKLGLQIKELNSKMETISVGLDRVSSSEKVLLDNENPIKNNKGEIVRLIMLKFESDLDFTNELSVLKSLNNVDNHHIFEKLQIISLDNFRGNNFTKNIFSNEVNIFLKTKKIPKSKNIIFNSIMRFVMVEPSKNNIINSDEVNSLNEIKFFLEKKNYIDSYEKLSTIVNYQTYFSETLKQLNKAIEFKKLIKRVG